MDMQRHLQTLKPVLAGAAGGVAVVAVFAFSMNWVYTAGSLQEQVNEARVSALSQVCEADAQHFWTDEKGMKVTKLEGWGNEQRQQLAQRFAPEVKIPSEDLYREDVVDACNDLLRPA